MMDDDDDDDLFLRRLERISEMCSTRCEGFHILRSIEYFCDCSRGRFRPRVRFARSFGCIPPGMQKRHNLDCPPCGRVTLGNNTLPNAIPMVRALAEPRTAWWGPIRRLIILIETDLASINKWLPIPFLFLLLGTWFHLLHLLYLAIINRFWLGKIGGQQRGR